MWRQLSVKAKRTIIVIVCLMAVWFVSNVVSAVIALKSVIGG